MPPCACGSHWKVYLPFLSVTVHVGELLPDTLVFLSTPDPLRWKLWIVAGSLTLTVHVPCGSDVTFFPPLVSEILNELSPPTEAFRVPIDLSCEWPNAGAPNTRPATTPIAMAEE